MKGLMKLRAWQGKNPTGGTAGDATFRKPGNGGASNPVRVRQFDRAARVHAKNWQSDSQLRNQVGPTRSDVKREAWLQNQQALSKRYRGDR
jgi:hypothetical protein